MSKLRENLGFLRLFLLLLAIFTVGRWTMSLAHVPYERGHHVFSIVTLSFISSAYYGAFARKWRGYGLLAAMGLALTLAVISQLVIVLSTAASYALGLQTYFNHPTALNVTEAVPLGRALGIRAIGLVANSTANAIVGLLGWLMGAVLSKSR